MSEIIVKLIDAPALEFKKYLELKDNYRLIVSAKFGSGKTTFLNEFFRDQHTYGLQKKYEVFKLFPVNYCISPNEDIFRYIKYDLLSELILKSSDYELFLEEKFSESLLRQGYIIERVESFLAVFSSFAGKLNKSSESASQIADSIQKIEQVFSQSYKGYKKNIQENVELNEIDSFRKFLEEKEGSLYESNAITEIIGSSLDKIRLIKSNGKQVENILLIDDLDRIDPHHIFNLLNIFSSHLTNETSNKFGFDKVLFVCDIANIESIFKHFYGSKTDFLGYIDKFYSRRIFTLRNQEILKEFIDKLINRTEVIVEGKLDESQRKIIFENKLVSHIVNLLVKNKVITIRNLIKTNSTLYMQNVVAMPDGITIPISSVPTVLAIDFISKIILGSYENLAQSCREIEDDLVDNINTALLDDFLLIAGRETHKFRRDQSEHAYCWDSKNVNLHYRITGDNPRGRYQRTSRIGDKNALKINDASVLIEFIALLKSIGFVKH